MKTRILKCIAAAATFCATSLAAAAPVSVNANFVFGWGGQLNYVGQFSAKDLNSDGRITVGEVTSIYESYGNHNAVSQLFDIGTIHIATQQWLANAVSWNGYPSTAFLTFDNRNWSCTTYNGCNARLTSLQATGGRLPEPGSLALIGVALAGVGAAASRKRQAS